MPVLPQPSRDVLDEVVDNRRYLHRHPEVSFAEHETSRFIEDRLRSLALSVEPCLTPTGALAFLDTGRAGRTVMLRADIDALPILEDSGVDFASDVDGRMLDLVHGTVPLMNDPNVTRTVLSVGAELIGERASEIGNPLTVSDDMAEFLTCIPGCNFMVGARPPDAETAPAHHSPSFRIDEGCFATGVRMMVGSAATLAAQAPADAP